MKHGLELADYLAAIAPYAAVISGLARSPIEPSIPYLVLVFVSATVSYNIYMYLRSLGMDPPHYWVFPAILATGLALHLALPGVRGLRPEYTIPILLAASTAALYGRGFFASSTRMLTALYGSVACSLIVATILLTRSGYVAPLFFITMAPLIEHLVSLHTGLSLSERLLRSFSYLSLLALTPPYYGSISLLGPLALVYMGALLYLRAVLSPYAQSSLLPVDYVLRSALVLLLLFPDQVVKTLSLLSG